MSDRLSLPLSLPAGAEAVSDSITSNGFGGFPDGSPLATDGELVGPIVVGGQRTEAFAVNPPVDRGGESITAGSESLWFDRIWVFTMRAFDVGQVIADTTRQYNLFSTFRVPVTLNAVNETGTDGITLTPPNPIPASYLPLQEDTYTINIDEDGPVLIDAILEHVFSGVTFDITIVGSRASLFPHIPENGLIERLGFLTDVQRGLDGTEQRIALRERPRQTFEAVYIETEEPYNNRLKNLLIGRASLGQTIGVPMFQQYRNLGADASINDTTVTVETDDTEWRDGGNLVLWRSADDFEVVRIDTVGSGVINVDGVLTQNHSASDTIVVPVFACLVRGNPRVETWKPGPIQASLTWESTDVPDDLANDGAWPTYLSKPVLDEPLFLSQGGGTYQEDLLFDFERLDSRAGKFEAFQAKQTALARGTKTWFCEGSAAACYALRGQLTALRGRQRSFWIPSYRADFTVTQPIAALDTSVTVQNVGYSGLIAEQIPYNHVEFLLVDGSRIRREITGSVEVDDDEETLTINANLGQGGVLQPADVRRVSFLYLARSDSDSVQIEWVAKDIWRVSLPIVGVLA